MRPLPMYNDQLTSRDEVWAGREQPGHVHHVVGGQHPLHGSMHHLPQPTPPRGPATQPNLVSYRCCSKNEQLLYVAYVVGAPDIYLWFVTQMRLLTKGV